MILVVGTTVVDLFIAGIEGMPRIDGDEFTSSSLTFCDRPLTMTLGGNGGNSAYVLAALGADVALHSATGLNPLGEMVTGWLQERGVDLRGFLRREKGTATTTTVMNKGMNRLSFYYPGIFDSFGAHDMPDGLLDEADALLVTGWSLLPGYRSEGHRAILEQGKAGGAVTYLDIGPAIGEPARLDEVAPLLHAVDVLLCNDYELGVCTGQDGIEAGIDALLDAGASTVVVKRGPEGARIHHDGQRLTASAYKVDAAVTIGAGDSFNSGLVYARQQEMDWADAAAFSAATAALVLESGKSVLGSPTVEQVQALIQQHG